MSEKTDIEKRVEGSFVKPDAEINAPAPPTASFASEPKEAEKEKTKQAPSMGDALMYIGMKLKHLNDKQDKTNELLEKIATMIGNKPMQTPEKAVSAPTSVSVSQPPQTQGPSTQADPKLAKIVDALKSFIDDNLIEIDSTSSNLMYLIKARRFLGTENFAKIAAVIRGLGGEYISQGKLSHFEVSKAS